MLLQLPLSVSFYQCYFSSPCQYHSTNVTSAPPVSIILPMLLQLPLSVSFYQCSKLIFNYVMLFPGQMDKAWELSEKQSSFGNPKALDRKVLSLRLKWITPNHNQSHWTSKPECCVNAVTKEKAIQTFTHICYASVRVRSQPPNSWEMTLPTRKSVNEGVVW